CAFGHPEADFVRQDQTSCRERRRDPGRLGRSLWSLTFRSDGAAQPARFGMRMAIEKQRAPDRSCPGSKRNTSSSLQSEGNPMNRPFNMPDEFVDGLMKAGVSLWQTLGGMANGERDDATPSSPLGSSGRIAELQADYLKGLYQLSERIIQGAA